MAIKTRSLGNNVSVVTYSLETTLPELVSAVNSEIIRRVEIGGTFISAHGWELIEELSSLDRVYRSICADGKTIKYLRMVFTETKLTLYAYTDWSVSTSMGVDEVCLSHYGSFEEIELNFEDRGNFYIFANPRWLAFCSKRYGSPITLNRKASGIHGIFETETYESDALDSPVPFCLLSTALIGGDHDGIGYIIPRLPVELRTTTAFGDFLGNGTIGNFTNPSRVLNTFGSFNLQSSGWWGGYREITVSKAGRYFFEISSNLPQNRYYISPVTNGRGLGYSYSSVYADIEVGVLDLMVGMYQSTLSGGAGFSLKVFDPDGILIFNSLDDPHLWQYVKGDLYSASFLIKQNPGQKISTVFGMIDPKFPNPEILPSVNNEFSGNGWAIPVVLMSNDNKLLGRVYGLKFGTRNKEFFLDKVLVDCDENYWNAHGDVTPIPTDHAIIPSGLGANGVTSARYLLPF